VIRPRLLVLAAAVGLIAGTGSASRSTTDPAEAAFSLEATGCPVINTFGGGLAVAPGRILTSAHVLAGAPTITVIRHGVRWPARVTVFDPRFDLALLAVSDKATPVVVPIGQPQVGALGSITVTREGRPLSIAVRIRQLATIQTEDIYREGHYDRPGYILGTAIEQGDSGNVVVVDGRAAAVLWARTLDRNDTAWGIDPSSMVPFLNNSAAIEHGHCS
jgi:S1-C subfamily serine protease